MNINSLSINAQEALQAAVSLAREQGNQAVEPLHLLNVLVREDDSLSVFLFLHEVAKAERTKTNATIASTVINFLIFIFSSPYPNITLLHSESNDSIFHAAS